MQYKRINKDNKEELKNLLISGWIVRDYGKFTIDLSIGETNKHSKKKA